MRSEVQPARRTHRLLPRAMLVMLLSSPTLGLQRPPLQLSARAPPLQRPSRRTAVRTLAALPLGLAPLAARPRAAHAGSQCVCTSITECVCGGDNGSRATGEYERQKQKEVDKIRKGGLYTTQTSEFSNFEYNIPGAPPPPQAAPPKGGKAGSKAAKERAPRDETKDLVPVKDFGSQTFADVDKDEAKQKFLAIVRQKIAEREAYLGFELDADDVKELVKPLRVKYCGPQGLIGPC